MRTLLLSLGAVLIASTPAPAVTIDPGIVGHPGSVRGTLVSPSLVDVRQVISAYEIVKADATIALPDEHPWNEAAFDIAISTDYVDYSADGAVDAEGNRGSKASHGSVDQSANVYELNEGA